MPLHSLNCSKTIAHISDKIQFAIILYEMPFGKINTANDRTQHIIYVINALYLNLFNLFAIAIPNIKAIIGQKKVKLKLPSEIQSTSLIKLPVCIDEKTPSLKI